VSIKDYKRKIDKYIESKKTSSKKPVAKSGLLAPTEKPPAGRAPEQEDAVATVGDFIAAIRERRMKLKTSRSEKKNGN
jgi:hypothetical protein